MISRDMIWRRDVKTCEPVSDFGIKFGIHQVAINFRIFLPSTTILATHQSLI